MKSKQSEVTGERIPARKWASLIEACEMGSESGAETVLRLLIERDELLKALNGLFAHCAMVHKNWGSNSNQREADEAVELAQAAISKAEGSDA